MILAEMRTGETCILWVRDHGQTDVCNMVSGLVCTLAGWVHNTADRVLECRTEPGDASIIAQGGEQMRAGFDFVAQGLRQLEASFPQELRFLEK